MDTKVQRGKKSLVHLSGPGHRCGSDLGGGHGVPGTGKNGGRRLSEGGAPFICNLSSLEVNEESSGSSVATQQVWKKKSPFNENINCQVNFKNKEGQDLIL